MKITCPHCKKTFDDAPLLMPVEPPPKKERKADPIAEVLCKLFGYNPQLPSEYSRLGKVVRDLKAKGATPESVKQVYDALKHRLLRKADTFHMEAVFKNWDAAFVKPKQECQRNTLEAETQERIRKENEYAEEAAKTNQRMQQVWDSLTDLQRQKYLSGVKTVRVMTEHSTLMMAQVAAMKDRQNATM